MDADGWKRIQIPFAILLVIALIRVIYIFHERNQPVEPPKPKTEAVSSSYKVTSDDYVTPKKIFPYDVKSAKAQLAGQPMWSRSGYQLPYYPYSNGAQAKQAGVFGPLEKVDVVDVVLQGNRVMAVFTRADGKEKYAVPIGTGSGGTFDFHINDRFFINDPHEIYSHWPADVWSAVDHHEAKPGMNELQVSYALGTKLGMVGDGEYGNRTLQFDNGGKPMVVTFSDNKATHVKEGKAE